MDFVKKYEEYGYINGQKVSMKKFGDKFDVMLTKVPKKKHEELIKKVLRSEEVTIRGMTFYYEERDVKTGAIKKQKY